MPLHRTRRFNSKAAGCTCTFALDVSRTGGVDLAEAELDGVCDAAEIPGKRFAPAVAISTGKTTPSKSHWAK